MGKNESSVVENVMQRRSHNSIKTWDRIFLITMLALPITIFLCGWIFVNFNSLLLAFQVPSGAWSLDSFDSVLKNIFSSNKQELFYITLALKNTGLWFLKDILMLPFQLLIAYFLYKKIRGYKFFQVMFYLPAIISSVAMANLFSKLVSPIGPLGELCDWMNIELPILLGDPDYVMPTMLFYSCWLGWGGNMLLLGGALARIPTEVLESARLDGAGPFLEFTRFIIPLVWSTMSTIIILSMTVIFASSGPVLLFFPEGQNKTATMGFWIYYKVKQGGPSAYNEVAAAGVLLTLIAVPVVMFVRWLLEKVPAVEY